MSALGSVERVLVLGIVVVIVAILGIAIWGATGDDPGVPAVVANDGGATRRTPVIVPLGDSKPAEAAVETTRGTPVADLNRWREGLTRRPVAEQPEPTEVLAAPAATRSDIPLKPAAEPAAQPPVAVQLPPERAPVESRPLTARPADSLPVFGPLPVLKPEAKAAEKPAGASAEPALPPAKPAAEPARPRTHTVASGETLWGIAVRYYGDSNIQEHIDALLEANPSVDPDTLYVGTALTLPATGLADVSRLPAPKQVAVLSGRLYEVKAGDTLSSIALEQLGDSSRWREIYELNRERIHDPSMVYAGATLRLPKD